MKLIVLVVGPLADVIFADIMSFSSDDQFLSKTKISPQAIQIVADTLVDDAFDECGSSFDYTTSVRATHEVLSRRQTQDNDVKSATQRFIEKGKFIQPFGCLLALDQKTLKVVACSENANEMLTLSSHDGPSGVHNHSIHFGVVIGTIFDAHGLAVLFKAFSSRDSSQFNPILVRSKTSGRYFYAMVHRVPHAFILDFEPVNTIDGTITVAGPEQSYMLAEKGIKRLQCFPGGSVQKLCCVMVQEIFEITDYDRVMAYKFHDDEHGEVVAEITKPGLEPYLGLHYPATDIPQVARFYYMMNMVRIICDCRAKFVKVVQDENFQHDVNMFGSTLRGPNSCHQLFMENMNSLASLVMAVVVVSDMGYEESGSSTSPSWKGKKLWGLVVCHNTTPRFVPIVLRNACKIITQVFAVHISQQTELESLILENSILHTQTLLCDKLLQEAPLSIVSRYPNIRDLVKCDGAVLYYENRFYKMGVTPSDFKIYDILTWISVLHPDSAGFITDSLCGSVFPADLSVSDLICGMAAVRIALNCALFWFRSHTDAVLNWGSAKHEPGEIDDDKKMHPRSSFKAFKEIVKTRSVPWKDIEISAIHSLQLMLWNTMNNEGNEISNAAAIQKKLQSLNVHGMQEETVCAEMVRLMETAMVPVLAVDAEGLVHGWNTKLGELTGLHSREALGENLLKLVEESSVDAVKRILGSALQGKEEKSTRFIIKTYGYRTRFGPAILQVDASAIRDVHGHTVRLCLVANNVTSENIIIDKFIRRESGYKAIMQNLRSLNPPIFGPDKFGCCREWNQAMTELSGWRKEEVKGKMLRGEVFGTRTSCCRLKTDEAWLNLGIALNSARCYQEPESTGFGFFERSGKYIECLLCTNRRLNAEGEVTGTFCFLQLASPKLMQVYHLQRMPEQTSAKGKETIAYIKRQVKNPLAGILYTGKMLEGINLNEEHNINLHNCQLQLDEILNHTDIDSMIDGYINLQVTEFELHEVFVASMTQVMRRIIEKSINLVNDFADDIMSMKLYGDGLRLQQVLADFLSTCVDFTPHGGQLGVSARLIDNTNLEESVQPGAHFELRITHDGCAVPEDLLKQMSGRSSTKSEDGISLFVSRKLVKLMNGDVQYLKEDGVKWGPVVNSVTKHLNPRNRSEGYGDDMPRDVCCQDMFLVHLATSTGGVKWGLVVNSVTKHLNPRNRSEGYGDDMPRDVCCQDMFLVHLATSTGGLL
ncbi:Phytochrome [Heracleum sosnowskyi]|uniref:Phytochrome n=1 Tax=Heracleum sosnowskyi TaxID=360622 RepID=A0AAD8HNL9_9APIA|nr:Phytochrome [Heracleum sosnowskyi]